MTYECFIKPGYSSQDIEADNAIEAKRIFVDRIRECLGTEHIIANNLSEDEDE